MSRPWVVFALGCLFSAVAAAESLEILSSPEINRGIKAVLEQSARRSVATLARPGGYGRDPQVSIPLPEAIARAREQLREMGRTRQLDELERGMNLAAEQALAQFGLPVQDAVRDLVIYDARGLVRGGRDSMSRYFRARSEAALNARLRPVVRRIVEREGLTRTYHALNEKARSLTLSHEAPATLEEYVARAALDGLYAQMAQEERRLRSAPATAASDSARRILSVAY